jgi:hypothetical protein
VTAPHAAIPPAMKEPGDTCQQGCHHLVPLAVCEPIVVDMVVVELWKRVQGRSVQRVHTQRQRVVMRKEWRGVRMWESRKKSVIRYV